MKSSALFVILMLVFLAPVWANEGGLDLGGSFRYRHEWIDEDTDTRNRQRIQAKVMADSKLKENLILNFELATGQDHDPRSSNQSLGEAFTSKPISLTMAQFTWSPVKAKGLSLHLGKVKNPFYSPEETELMWDGDLRPEGGVFTYFGEFTYYKIGFNAGGFWIEERANDKDPLLFGGQVFANLILSNFASILIGGGFYEFTQIKGSTFFYGGDSFGNSADSVSLTEDYRPVEGFGEFNFRLGPVPFSLFANFAVNTQVNDENLGWLGGLSIGKGKKEGTAALLGYYRMLEKDAVFGTFTDSDFGGGGTDNRGLEFAAKYAVTGAVSFQMTYFFNDLGANGGKLYQRLQTDMKVKI